MNLADMSKHGHMLANAAQFGCFGYNRRAKVRYFSH